MKVVFDLGNLELTIKKHHFKHRKQTRNV